MHLVFAHAPLLLLASMLGGVVSFASSAIGAASDEQPRVIVTTDGEVDDRCSMIRFLLSSNEFDVEAIVNSSSQFHWEGGAGWNALHPASWVKDQIKLYAKVHDNLLLHDPRYPSPEYLLSRWRVGNISAVGEDDVRTEGAALIAKVLLDASDPRPVWIQAWGGVNTISRALKNIEQDHPERMAEVAAKLRLFLIWEQDGAYQEYIRPTWEPLGVLTIISDQFDCMAYIWPKVLPENVQTYFRADWMRLNLLDGHGPLCAAYESNAGAFNAEGDTPAFLHTLPNGLRSVESPAWGGWGGRYVNVRRNVWMDASPASEWQHPDGRWGIANSWSKKLENATKPEDVRLRTRYFKPIWRWLPAVQNDLAARANWCVKSYDQANHPPKVALSHGPSLAARAGETVKISVTGTSDPDGDALTYRWWHYREAETIAGAIHFNGADRPEASFNVPPDAPSGASIHAVCEVTDQGEPPLTRYARVVVPVE